MDIFHWNNGTCGHGQIAVSVLKRHLGKTLFFVHRNWHHNAMNIHNFFLKYFFYSVTQTIVMYRLAMHQVSQNRFIMIPSLIWAKYQDSIILWITLWFPLRVKFKIFLLNGEESKHQKSQVTLEAKVNTLTLQICHGHPLVFIPQVTACLSVWRGQRCSL